MFGCRANKRICGAWIFAYVKCLDLRQTEGVGRARKGVQRVPKGKGRLTEASRDHSKVNAFVESV